MKTFLLKWMFCLVAAVGLTLSFSACSDDDNEDDTQGNGQGAGNGGSGVTVLAKKVSKIVEKEGQSETTYLFSYDSEGKLLKIFRGENEVEKEFRYETNKISIYRNNELRGEITLKDGKAVSEKGIYGADEYSLYTYTYNGNYIAKMHEDSYYKGEKEYAGTSTFVVKDKNLVGVNYVEDDDPTDIDNIALEPSGIANNANIDFYGWVMEEDSWLLCVLGNRFQNLPAKTTNTWKDEEQDGSVKELKAVTTYTYEVDKDKYVTKITETYTDEEERSETKTYTITYE